MLELLTTPETWFALVSLTALELILGIDFPKGYLYLPIGFALAVELLNIRVEKAEAVRAERLGVLDPEPDREPRTEPEPDPASLIH
ncbi:hypothetical protein [Glycomyces buryatensis]|uniref:hypothetical protein n=1 Tax=Glycomyces buryatensis TaxID=2570927 RepID=UPI001B3C15E3|nr:hypothetical protein [Glycomyces buryatensis]